MKIAVLAGDGIGPEIMAQAVRVMEALRSDGLKIEFESAPVGGAGYDAAGDPLPAKTLDLARQADAVLFGAVGGPKYDVLARPLRPEQGLLRLRKELGLFANLRPAVVYPELAGASTLKSEVVAGLDLMILRELTGDI
jgi:3-isopropylmalate dehydrogenase